jgi:hypothetical protein
LLHSHRLGAVVAKAIHALLKANKAGALVQHGASYHYQQEKIQFNFHSTCSE